MPLTLAGRVRSIGRRERRTTMDLPSFSAIAHQALASQALVNMGQTRRLAERKAAWNATSLLVIEEMSRINLFEENPQAPQRLQGRGGLRGRLLARSSRPLRSCCRRSKRRPGS